MRLTSKLLSFLSRVFNRNPEKFLAFRLRYSGGMTWRVADAVLYTTVTGGPGQNLTIDLTAYRIVELVNFLAAQPGYSVLYADQTELAGLSARVLLDGTNDIALSNGDHISGYTNVLWAYFEAVASELARAEAQILEMLKQMSTRTASLEWLDELGGYYGIPRLAGELDNSYGPRIIAEVLRPRANNVAMEAAIKEFTGQSATVTDVVLYGPTFPLFNGAINFDGSHTYNAESVPLYGLFDVEYGYDLLNGGDISNFAQVVRDLINRLRDAGTHLRALNLTGSALMDTFTAPTDGGSLTIAVSMPLADSLTAPTESMGMVGLLTGLSDSLSAPAEDAALSIDYNYTYSGLRTYDGSITHMGVQTVVESI